MYFWSRAFLLRALGMDDELAHSSVRFSFGRFTTEEIDYAIEQIRVAVTKLRDMSPMGYVQGRLIEHC